MDQEL